jgi:hypothetical protein
MVGFIIRYAWRESLRKMGARMYSTQEVIAMSHAKHRTTVINAIQQGYLNAKRIGGRYAILDDEKLREYIDNPPKRGVKSK